MAEDKNENEKKESQFCEGVKNAAHALGAVADAVGTLVDGVKEIQLADCADHAGAAVGAVIDTVKEIQP